MNAGVSAVVPPEVSVVIPVRDGRPHLAEQLDAMIAQDFAGSFEVVISDNGSTDGSAAFALAWDDRLRLRIVDSSGTAGVSHARNVGVRAAAAQMVLICDADDVVCPEWISRMTHALTSHDLVGGPRRTDRINPPPQAAWRPMPPRLPGAQSFMLYAVGSNTGFRRAVFDRISGYDERLVGGGDDMDFSWRAQLEGYDLGFAPGALVHYRVRPSLGTLYRQSRGYGRATSALYCRFRSHGMQRRLRSVVYASWWLLTRAPFALVDGRQRGVWLRMLGMLQGRLEGWFVYRTIC